MTLSLTLSSIQKLFREHIAGFVASLQELANNDGYVFNLLNLICVYLVLIFRFFNFIYFIFLYFCYFIFYFFI